MRESPSAHVNLPNCLVESASPLFHCFWEVGAIDGCFAPSLHVGQAEGPPFADREQTCSGDPRAHSGSRLVLCGETEADCPLGAAWVARTVCNRQARAWASVSRAVRREGRLGWSRSNCRVRLPSRAYSQCRKVVDVGREDQVLALQG